MFCSVYVCCNYEVGMEFQVVTHLEYESSAQCG